KEGKGKSKSEGESAGAGGDEVAETRVVAEKICVRLCSGRRACEAAGVLKAEFIDRCVSAPMESTLQQTFEKTFEQKGYL
ncbi:hypothetical protein TYRP_006267, partial [Tyrophagus putrescentiae]